MDITTLQASLKKIQEPLGYFFNRSQDQVESLLQGLLTNRKRYGYISCPCRLASGKKELDRDIICPCIYREPDVEEFGSCYCGLYVSREWKENKMSHFRVPERRPPAGQRV